MQLKISSSRSSVETMIGQQELSRELSKLQFLDDEFRLLQLAKKVIERLFWLRTEPHVVTLDALEEALAVLRLSVPAALPEGYSHARDELMRALIAEEISSTCVGEKNRLRGMTKDRLFEEIEVLKSTAVHWVSWAALTTRKKDH
jgi:hypothetical protein